MIKLKLSFILVIAILRFLPAEAQNVSTRQIELAEILHALAKNAPPELAYIQTSKDVYETGEDLWFKVYLLDAQYLIPSGLSKTLYLQLIEEKRQKAVWQEKYEIQNGFSDGRVYLDSNLPEGDYLLEAFTPNSFFSDTSGFYAVRKIKILRDISSPPLLKAESDVHGKSYPIQFTTFPEGGDLVSGIQTRLAFKAVTISGEPIDIKGTLFENDVPLIVFKSIHAGMGSFNFIPDIQKKYLIRLSQPVVDSIFLIPKIFPAGMTLHLTGRDKESLSFIINQSVDLKDEEICLRVQCRGEVYGITSVLLKRQLRIKVPLDSLPQGIAEVTLFNGDLMPVAERLVYINNEKLINITAELSKEIYPTRAKATLKITAKDEKGNPVEANLGVTVFDKLYQNSRYSNSILTHFYLSSQLKGRIYDPSYYFDNRGKDVNEALDLLMQTQGWRKYVWSEENLKQFRGARQKVVFDEIRGNLFYPYNMKRIPKEQLFIVAFSPNKDSSKVIVPADSTGVFSVDYELLKKWENDYVYLKPFGPYDSQVPKKTWAPLAPTEFKFNIGTKNPFETINQLSKKIEIVYPFPGLANEMKDTSSSYISGSDVVRIKEVTIKAQKANIFRGKYLGSLDSIVKTKADEDYVCQYGVLNCPRHGHNEPGTSRPIQSYKYSVIFNYNTPAEYTRKVTYWRPKYSVDELLRTNNLTRIKAYYGPREFYKPNYDKDLVDSLIPDFRNTLLWEPSVITDENGEATLSFFCSDINTDFVGRIEGVSGTGLLGTGNFKFTVRKLKVNP